MTARNLLDVTDDGVQFDKGTLKVDVLDNYADFVCGDYLVYNSDEITPSGKADFTFEVLNELIFKLVRELQFLNIPP